MRQIVECVANFSEGRRRAAIEEIVASVAGVNGVAILGYESDADHNRSVVTFAGPPNEVAEAAFAGIRAARRLIDMEMHRGQHPRIGAADVVPFVPLRNVSMAECVRLARALGARVGQELRIPVFLYQKAALKQNNRELADIRRGGYERLKKEIRVEHARQPDFGPCELGSAGACVIGARDILIAFNVYLSTGDALIARRIARQVRQSSGGLPHVKALGLLINGKAQVSMNLTDYRITSIHRAVEAVRQAARALSHDIERTELVGLLPRAALQATTTTFVHIDNFTPGRVLELQLVRCFGEI